MITLADKCVTVTTESNPKFEEKGKKIVFQNPQRLRVKKVRVDGCVLTAGDKCDNMLITPAGDEHYVELKGNDVMHAIKQLEQTITQLHNDDSAVLAYVVCRSQPPAISTGVQRAIARFKARWNAPLAIRERSYTTTLTR